MKIVTFLMKNVDPAKRVVDFPRERETFRKNIMEIVKDFACESKFLHVSFFFHHFFSIFRFFHFFIFSFFHFSFIFLSFSFS